MVGFLKVVACLKFLLQALSAAFSEADAKTQCAGQSSGTLPIITSKEDNDAVKAFWKGLADRENDPTPWIGLSCSTDKKTDCKWDDSTVTTTYEDFATGWFLNFVYTLLLPNVEFASISGEPKSGTDATKKCVIFGLTSPHKWFSNDCGTTRLVICEARGGTLFSPLKS
jgi:hypothetical protein